MSNRKQTLPGGGKGPHWAIGRLWQLWAQPPGRASSSLPCGQRCHPQDAEVLSAAGWVTVVTSVLWMPSDLLWSLVHFGSLLGAARGSVVPPPLSCVPEGWANPTSASKPEGAGWVGQSAREGGRERMGNRDGRSRSLETGGEAVSGGQEELKGGSLKVNFQSDCVCLPLLVSDEWQSCRHLLLV